MKIRSGDVILEAGKKVSFMMQGKSMGCLDERRPKILRGFFLHEYFSDIKERSTQLF